MSITIGTRTIIIIIAITILIITGPYNLVYWDTLCEGNTKRPKSRNENVLPYNTDPTPKWRLLSFVRMETEGRRGEGGFKGCCHFSAEAAPIVTLAPFHGVGRGGREEGQKYLLNLQRRLKPAVYQSRVLKDRKLEWEGKSERERERGNKLIEVRESEREGERERENENR